MTPKAIQAKGKPATISVRITAGKKPVSGVRVLFSGWRPGPAPRTWRPVKGVRKTAITNRRGIAIVRVNMRVAGLVRVNTISKRSCGAGQIGVVTEFKPPTG